MDSKVDNVFYADEVLLSHKQQATVQVRTFSLNMW